MDEGDEKYWMKVHHSYTGEIILAACDRDLLGRRLKVADGFEVLVSESFYMGRLASWEEVRSLIAQVTIVNLVGNGVVGRAVREGLVPERACRDVGGVKHVQIMRY
ncbi:MAG: DUF424 family protein [Nitrososphaerota archaeon]|nr:DUF424 family protein [Candidatus Calditenuis fumarioli]